MDCRTTGYYNGCTSLSGITLKAMSLPICYHYDYDHDYAAYPYIIVFIVLDYLDFHFCTRNRNVYFCRQ